MGHSEKSTEAVQDIINLTTAAIRTKYGEKSEVLAIVLSSEDGKLKCETFSNIPNEILPSLLCAICTALKDDKPDSFFDESKAGHC